MFSMVEEVKDKLFLVAVIILIGLIGFGLGRLSSRYQTAELNINSTIANTADLSKVVVSETTDKTTDRTYLTNTTEESAGVAAIVKIIGNKNSKIYHREDCPGALKMSETNKVFFNSIEEAKGAGYKPAGNCPGLE